MEEVMSRLQTLSPDQLRQEIIRAGLKCGPLTTTTRAIFERKLARALLEKQVGDGGVTDRGSSSNTESNGPTTNRVETDHNLELKSSAEEGKETEELDEPESPLVYYGVCPHWEESVVADEKVHVYVDRKKALRAMMTMKGSRFKPFSTREEAEKFSKGINDNSPSASTSAPDGPQRVLEPVVHTGSPIAGGTSPVNLERANEFRSPRTQDLTAKLRKAVEKGDKEAFSRLVWSNPRYLIGSGDNPTIVHEGCHYNVLHVAAKENQSGMVQLLLDTLESPDFMRLMYPDDQEAMLHQRIRYLVDLYLNTPDKASNETPLHFACKFGCPDVVNVLCCHPATDKHRQNKYNQKPSSVICERKNKTPYIKKKINEYLEERCYVPLLRDTNNSFQPVIGLPWSPSPLEVDFNWLGSAVGGSPIEPVMTVRAYVGPLSPSKADEFHRLWRTPPRDRAEYFHRILKSDPDRGAERVGREIAHDMGHPWAEYWDFLDSFIDLSTEEGLRRLEEYLDRKDQSEPPLEGFGKTEETGDGFKTSTPSKEEQNQSHVPINHILNDRRCLSKEKGSQSPVCNLLPEFEKASLKDGSVQVEDPEEVKSVEGRLAPSVPRKEGLDLGDGSFWRIWEGSQGKRQVEELSNPSSEEYLTADEGSDSEGPGSPRDRRGSGSSSASYKSTKGDASKETILTIDTPTRQRQELFMDGESPTKLDSEVLSAMNNMEIDPERNPCITKWRNTILAYPSSQWLSWPRPTRRKSLTGTPDCSPNRLSFCSPGPHTPAQSCYTQTILCRTLFRSPN
ncbi:ankyrin repeat and LEM domain-containing protein 2 [Coregonus clupeaformis]|uniref:ankyrin repeat and LEM domain-containing protein 2 n=1 Tax=Coregonus clupeaformis TaxID=59861 RepID=UPI001BE0C3F8|nr:ankyrin repeat and LEM domain-containing protein 2 [Coregonus clupeaformis]